MTRTTFVIVTVVAVAVGASCSSFEEAPATTTTSPSDGGAPDDASSPSAFCSGHPRAVFCADFEGADPKENFVERPLVNGALEAVAGKDGVGKALRSAISPGVDNAAAEIERPFTLKTPMKIAVSVALEGVPIADGARVSVVRVDLGGGAYFHLLVAPTIVHLDYELGGPDQNGTLAAIDVPLVGTLKRVELDIRAEGAATSVTTMLDGVGVGTQSFPTDLTAGRTVTLRLGARNYGGRIDKPFASTYDDVLVEPL